MTVRRPPAGDESASNGSPDHTGHVALRMTTWDGRRSENRFFGSWADTVKFLRSDDFTLMRDIRSLTVKQLNPPRTALGGSHWRPSPEEAAGLEARGQQELTCRACIAAPGEPCTDPEPGRTVHGPRFIDAKKAAIAEAAHGRRAASGRDDD